jgi:hypothetical protein
MPDPKTEAKVDRVAVRVSREHHEALKALSEEQDKPVSEVLEALISRALLSAPRIEPGADGILDDDTRKSLLSWAEERSMTPVEAARRLITVAIGRLRALSTYGSKFRKRD